MLKLFRIGEMLGPLSPNRSWTKHPWHRHVDKGLQIGCGFSSATLDETFGQALLCLASFQEGSFGFEDVGSCGQHLLSMASQMAKSRGVREGSRGAASWRQFRKQPLPSGSRPLHWWL